MKNKFQKIQRPLVFGLSVLATVALKAQTANPTQAISNVNTQVRSVFAQAGNLFMGLCALIAIVGAIHVFTKWTSGDPNTTKVAANWVAALIFCALVTIVIKAMTGVA